MDALMKRVFLVTVLCFSGFQSGAESEVDDVNADQSIVDKIGRRGLSADLRLIGASFFDNSYVRGGYKYIVEPSFSEGLMTRIDRYYFEANLEPIHEIRELPDEEISLGFSVNNRVEVDFVRHFESANEATRVRPYFAKNLPLNSERALSGLLPSDLVMMKSRLGLMVKGRFFHELGLKDAGFELEAWYLIAGEFQVHVLRLGDSKVRLKLIGLRNDEQGVKASVSFLSELKVFKVRRIDDRITELLDLNPIVLTWTKSKNSLFLVDYELSLADAKVREAFDKTMKNATRFSDGSLVDPRKTVEQIRDSVILDLAALEEIAKEDSVLAEPRVQRSFKGTAHSRLKESEIKLGVRFLKTSSQTKNSINRIVAVDKDEKESYFLMDSHQRKVDSSFGFGWLRLQTENELNALYSTDAKFETRKLENLIFYSERFDKSFREREFNQVKRQLKQSLPQAVFKGLPLERWNPSGIEKIQNVAVTNQVVVQPSLFSLLPSLNRRQIAQSYYQYLETIPWEGLARNRNPGSGSSDAEIFFSEEVERMGRRLDVVFSSASRVEDKAEAIMNLRNSRLFRQTGVGYLASFVTPQVLDQHVRVDFLIESNPKNAVDYAFGQKEAHPLYRRILYLQSILHKDGLDIRLESEGIKLREIRAERP